MAHRDLKISVVCGFSSATRKISVSASVAAAYVRYLVALARHCSLDAVVNVSGSAPTVTSSGLFASSCLILALEGLTVFVKVLGAVSWNFRHFSIKAILDINGRTIARVP